MDPSNQLMIYRWADAPKRFHRPFARTRRDWIAFVPKGRTLGPTHWVLRLEDTVEKTRRDGSTLIAGNEPKPSTNSSEEA